MLKKRQKFLQSQHNIACEFSRNKTTRIITLSRDVVIVDAKIIEEINEGAA